ncbi:MAG: hypothetical protein ACK5O2_10970, partial [Microthrixaceae bacterium]
AEPRRARLLSLRLGAVLTVGVGSYLVAAVGFLVVIAPAWAFRSLEGTSVSVPAIAASVGRGALAAALVVLISSSLAVIGRGPMLSLGVLVGLTVITGGAFLFVRTFVPLEFFTNVWAVLTGGAGIRAYRFEDSFTRQSATFFGRGWPFGAALAVVLAYAAVAIAGAYATFMRRDIR